MTKGVEVTTTTARRLVALMKGAATPPRGQAPTTVAPEALARSCPPAPPGHRGTGAAGCAELRPW